MALVQRSPKQQAASRANGARSRGPVSPQGKRRSSQNAFRDGFRSPCVMQLTEDDPAFARFHDGFTAALQPRTPAEAHAVRTMAVARSRIAAVWDRSYVLYNPHLDSDAKRRSTSYLNRVESHFERLFRRAFADLTRLRTERKNCANEPGTR